MTPQEVIDHAKMALETIEAKNEAEGGCIGCDEKAKDFYKSVIKCARTAERIRIAKEEFFVTDRHGNPWYKVEDR